MADTAENWAVLGKYEVLEEIGSGSMGTVHRARDSMLDREIALKLMRTGPHVAPEIRERFYREARACARLQHPNIVAVYDLGECDGLAYIAMELLHGADWRTAIRQQLPVPLAARLELMAQVCDALAHAHAFRIVHRDIKPSNLYIHRQQQAKVLDFGIARLPTSSLTLSGRVLGTPNYMAPEQILGQPCDARSDLFSAAVVFFEFLTGVHPFRAPFIPRRIVEGEPDSLCEVDSKMPGLLDAVFTKMLSKSAALRFASGEEFAAGLRSIARELSSAESPKGRAAAKGAAEPLVASDASQIETLSSPRVCANCGAWNAAAEARCAGCGAAMPA